MPSVLVVEVPLSAIRLGRGRPLSEKHVEQLMSSMAEVGLLEPVIVGKDYSLIAGYHRFKAAQRLGWETIQAVTFEGDAIDAQIATIDENLIRRELTVAERSELLAERKRLYEEKHPETKHGGDRKNDEIKTRNPRFDPAPSSFTADVAAKTGRGRRTVEEEVRIGERLAPDVMEKVKASPIADSKAALKSLADLPPERQRGIPLGPEVKQADVAKQLEREVREQKKKMPAKRRPGRVEPCPHDVVTCDGMGGCGKTLHREGKRYVA
jgi:ParB family chromosome partitioning protein